MSSQQAPAAGAAGAQRSVAACREEARGKRLRGDERKAFLRDCTGDIRQSCREQARSQNVTGDARRDFMVSCTGTPPRNTRARGAATGAAAPPAADTPAPAPKQ